MSHLWIEVMRPEVARPPTKKGEKDGLE